MILKCILLLIYLLLLSCIQNPADSDKQDNSLQGKIRQSAAEVKNEVELFRKKTFLRPVSTCVYTRSEYTARQKQNSSNIAPEDRVIINKILQCEGFMKPGDDYFADYIDMISVSTGGYYEDGTDTINVVVEDGAIFPDPDLREELFHEFVHALQDQYYNLDSLFDQTRSSDNSYALRYVIEGESQLLSTYYSYKLYYGTYPTSSTPVSDFLNYMASDASIYLDSLHRIGERMYLHMPFISGYYSYGPLFIDNIAGMNWTYIDSRIFTDLPKHTREVMHSWYYTPNRPAYAVSLSPLLSTIDTAFTIYEIDELGEILTCVLMKEYDVSNYIGWSSGLVSDKMVIAGPSSPDSMFLLWYTWWQTPDNAVKFLNAYKSVLEAKYSVNMPSPGTADTASTSLALPQLYLGKYGCTVIVMEKCPSEYVDTWKELLKSGSVVSLNQLTKTQGIEFENRSVVKKAMMQRRNYFARR